MTSNYGTTIIENLAIGDKILPPERELRLWMRRALQEKGLSDDALILKITDIQEGSPDKRGRWMIITADQSPEWFVQCKPYPFKFKARPDTEWKIVSMV